MSFTVRSLPIFNKEFKALAKKYPSLVSDVEALGAQLRENPTLGVPIGHGCYKIRLAIRSKGKGKRSGARVATNVYIEGETVTMLSIYDKSEKAAITDKELTALLKMLPQLPSKK